MSKVVYSGIAVVYMSGKVGGSVFSFNKGGTYVKNWVIPTNPQTARQTTIRALVAAFSSAWSGLTQVQRDAWNLAAPSFPVINNIGNTIILSGQGLFIQLNVVRFNTLPPTPAVLILPPGFLTVVDWASLVVVATPIALTFTSTTVAGLQAVPAGQTLTIYATRPLSAGVTNFESELRQIVVLTTGTPTLNASIAIAYTAKYGGLPPLNSKVGIAIVSNTVASGQSGYRIKASDIS